MDISRRHTENQVIFVFVFVYWDDTVITDNQMIFVWMDVLSLLRVQIRNKRFWGKLYLADTSNKHVKHEHYVPSIMRKVSLVPFCLFCFVEFICCYFVCNETIPCRYWKTSFDQQIFRNAYEYLVNKATNQTLTVVGVSSPPYIIYRITSKTKDHHPHNQINHQM